MAHPLHLVLPPNDRGHDFYVGDILGCRDLLFARLEWAGFRIQKDRLIAVGDLVDRGPHSAEVLALMEEAWFFAVRGNHEEMMLDGVTGSSRDRDYWRHNGGAWGDEYPQGSLEALVDLANTMPIAMTVEQQKGPPVGITHAEFGFSDWADVEKYLDQPKARDSLIWGRRVIKTAKRRNTKNVLCTIHGHTPLDEVTRLGNAIFIDTGAVYDGTLTLARLDDLIG